MGVSLSAAEKLAAIPGPWPTWIVELLKKYVGEVGTLGTAITWDQSRGRPFQIVAGFVLMALDPGAKATIPSAQMLNKFLHRADPPDKLFKHKIEMALSLFVKIATEHFGDSFGVVEPRVAPVGEWITHLARAAVPGLTRRMVLHRPPHLHADGCSVCLEPR